MICSNQGFDTLFFLSNYGNIDIYILKENGRYEKFQSIKSNSTFSKISFDDKQQNLVTGSEKGEILVVKKDRTKKYSVLEMNEVKKHSNWVSVLTIDNKNDRLFSGSYDKNIMIWKLGKPNDYKMIQTLRGHKNNVWAIEYDNESDYLYSGGGDSTIIIWSSRNNTLKFQKIKTLNIHSKSVYRLFLCPKTKKLFSGSFDMSIRVQKVTNEEQFEVLNSMHIPYAHNAWVTSLQYIYDQGILLSSDRHGFLKIWRQEKSFRFKEIKQINIYSSEVRSILYIKKLSLVIAACFEGVKIFDISEWVNK